MSQIVHCSICKHPNLRTEDLYLRCVNCNQRFQIIQIQKSKELQEQALVNLNQILNELPMEFYLFNSVDNAFVDEFFQSEIPEAAYLFHKGELDKRLLENAEQFETCPSDYGSFKLSLKNTKNRLKGWQIVLIVERFVFDNHDKVRRDHEPLYLIVCPSDNEHFFNFLKKSYFDRYK